MRLTRPVQISSVPEIDNSALAAINSSFDTLEKIPDWRYVADLGLYQNAWADAGTGDLRVRFRRNFDGTVYFEGQATRATPPAAATAIFGPLPAGYFPQNSIHFLVPDVGAANPSVTEISVDSSGISFQAWNGGAGAMHPHIVISYAAHRPR